MNSISENNKSENFCRHEDRKKVSNVIGFTAFASTGVLCKRNGIDYIDYQGSIRRPTDPRKICKSCGMLALLGTWYATFVFSVADREVIAIPIPKRKIKGSKLQEIFSLQHQIRKNWFGQEIPQVLIPLIFLSKIPSSADILDGFDLFIAVLSRQQGYHVEGVFLMPISNYLEFLRASPYNNASVDTMLRKEAFVALQELNNIIYYGALNSLAKFARLYVQETSTNNFTNLLYTETSKYLLKEVAMINSDIIENQSLGSLARTLRYFIREKKYGYADDIRNAREDSRVFETTVAKMLREGRLRLEQKKMIHLPTDEEMKEVFRLANADFENTKTALVILAFSFTTRAEEETNEIIEEVQNA
jgi:CRISPR type I-A-associated protein Csa5